MEREEEEGDKEGERVRRKCVICIFITYLTKDNPHPTNKRKKRKKKRKYKNKKMFFMPRPPPKKQKHEKRKKIQEEKRRKKRCLYCFVSQAFSYIHIHHICMLKKKKHI